ncbi:uncharacterized protein SOCE26_041880 [Sorangium cellulosum]|uniref:Secreted protein n=1 Tax=Sorangium cellulosum TaxID=56 RepID=A0A2L0ETZ2_SORCE|nr:hypothetical protein [Sorangium cellulosum]AUX42755.1 uncharacterized protein SOCE26_041880 [Sorangium cellulosum]
MRQGRAGWTARAVSGFSVLLLASCSGASPAGPAHRPAARCDPARIEPCERALAAAVAEGRAAGELALGYVEARAARNAGDPWALLLRDLDRRGGPRPTVAVIVEAGAKAAGNGARGATWIHAAPLPAPGALGAEALLLALGEALGYEHLVYAPARRGRTAQIFPRDPLGPFMAGAAPIAAGDASLARIADDIAIAALVRRAFSDAGRFRYVEAARAADALAAALKGRAAEDEPALRGHYALQLLGTAGIALDDGEDGAAPATPAAPPAEPPPAPHDTPYGDLLRVRTARDGRAAWRARGAAVLRAVPADRRAALDDLLGKPPGCGQGAAPPMEGARDLVFAAALAGALAPRAGAAAPSAPRGRLPLEAWLPRYEALVRAVDQTSTTWAHAPSLLYERAQRGGAPEGGAGPAAGPPGSAVYRRVTELGLAHLAALRALAEAEPRRYRALAQIPLAYSPGVLADPRLRDAVVDLTQVAVQRRMAEARDAEAVLGAALTGVFAGMAYPPEVQPAHFLALQGALTAKLRGELTAQSGWGVAGLYAADALYRVLSDQAPDLAFSSAQIGRALAPAPELPYPDLAALAAALSRYAALGVAGALDPRATDAARFPPERREARDALRRAVAGLAAAGGGPAAEDAPPPGIVEDVATLADGVLAVLFSERARKRDPEPAKDTCPAAGRGPSPESRRALARLGDVRGRILFAPRYRQGDGAWARRARLLVTVLSDVMDLLAAPPRAPSAGGAGAPEPRVRFTIPTADAEAAVAAALSDGDDRALAEAVTGGYGLARAVLGASTAERFAEQSGAPLGRMLRGLAGVFRGDAGPRGPGQGSAGVALLDALASLPPAPAESDLGGLLVGYARAFSALGLRDQADLGLLASLLGAAVLGRPPAPEAVALANDSGSRVAWALSYLAEIAKARRGVAPDPSAYADAMRRASDDACQAAPAGDVLAVMGAARDFAAGRRAEARDALDRLLEAADARGLHVPRMTYRYEEKTATRVFSLSVDVSYGAGLLEGSTGFQLGLGLRTRGAPEGALTAALAPEGSPQADEDAARAYVSTAALAAAYHFLERDAERGAAAARRAIAALSFGLRLGGRALPSERPLAWGRDARALLAIDAQLAVEAGHPFLAGDLWTLVRGLLPPDTDDAAAARLLEPLPAGLAALADLRPLVSRTARSLAAVAAPLPCTAAKVELGGYEEPACDAYPLALSLRIADVLGKLPHLRRAGSAAACPMLRSLDDFLTAAERGTYDPDAFTAAVEALRQGGRLYDAGVLLARQRRDGHCGPLVLAAARALGRAPALGPALRADLLSVAVSCAAAALDASVVDDLMALDDATRALPDLGRNLKVVLFATELAVREQRWDVLARLSKQPELVERWAGVSAGASATALLIQTAAAVLAGEPAPRDRGALERICGPDPSGDRAEPCAETERLLAAGALPEPQRRQRAKEALERLLAAARGQARQPARAPLRLPTSR